MRATFLIGLVVAMAACGHRDDSRVRSDSVSGDSVSSNVVHDTVVVTDTIRVNTPTVSKATYRPTRIVEKLVRDTVTITVHDTVLRAGVDKVKYVDRASYDRCMSDRAEAIKITTDFLAERKRALAARSN